MQVVEMPLHNRKGEVVGHAIVDHADWLRLREYRWHLNARGYVARNQPRGIRPRGVLMHREILGLGPGDPQVDHVNRDRLNNRRENLRVATQEQNSQNLGSRGGTSGHRGVYWSRSNRGWVAQCVVRGVHNYLGTHRTEEAAAEAVRRFRAIAMPFSAEARA